MKMNINLTDIDSNALEYIIDLIEKDFKDNEGNSARGGTFFQAVWVLKNLLNQEIYLARREASRKDEHFDGVEEDEAEKIYSWIGHKPFI